MSWLRFTASVALLLPLAPSLLGSCGGGDASPDNPTDSGTADADVADSRTPFDSTPAPRDDTGPVRHCTLDNGTDPVALCLQKVIFRQWHEAAFIKDLGVAESWDSTTFLPDKSTTGETLHQKLDDARYAAAIARYRISAMRYGDTELSDLRTRFLMYQPNRPIYRNPLLSKGGVVRVSLLVADCKVGTISAQPRAVPGH